ncbi:AAA family ATPase [archaeon]|jgi:dephospho-CoA kinase|nr:AAA family ATPase [archaeon]
MIIGIAGRIAAGKETLTKFLRDKGVNYFETRRILSETLEEMGLEASRSNMQDLGDRWRGEGGAGALMEKILEKINYKDEDWIIDSLRNGGEAEFLREKLGKDFVLISVDAPREIRFKRIVDRGKKSDMLNWDNFLKVDERDDFDKENPMGQQTGRLIGMSDHVIMNDGILEDAMSEIKKAWEEINK